MYRGHPYSNPPITENQEWALKRRRIPNNNFVRYISQCITNAITNLNAYQMTAKEAPILRIQKNTL